MRKAKTHILLLKFIDLFQSRSPAAGGAESRGGRGDLYLYYLQVLVALRLEPPSTRPEAWWPRRMTGSAASCNEAKLYVYVSFGVHPLSWQVASADERLARFQDFDSRRAFTVKLNCHESTSWRHDFGGSIRTKIMKFNDFHFHVFSSLILTFWLSEGSLGKPFC